MKAAVLVILATGLLYPPISAQKVTKEQKQQAKTEEDRERTRPRLVTIKTTVQAIKAEVITVYLAEGQKLCKELPSQLTFCEDLGVRFAYTDTRETLFTLVETNDGIVLTASIEILRRNVMGGERRIPAMDKKNREKLQRSLDQLKRKLEAH